MKIDQFLPNIKNQVLFNEIFPREFFEQKTAQPFDKEALDFLNEISRQAFLSPEIKKYPELSALSYWVRKSSISAIIKDFKIRILDGEVVVPRGVVFHIAPSNVDSIFMYSWALSLVVGNINIVRVSQDHSLQMALLLEIIQKILKDKKFSNIAKRNKVITYPHEDKISSGISKLSDVRVIWGGNETVDYFKDLPCPRTTKDIVFADKWSHSVIEAKKFNSLKQNEREGLSKKFYNDSYWFDQMACSSPRVVFFVGKEAECAEANQSFWRELNLELQRRNSSEDTATSMNKLIYLYERAKITDDIILPYKPEAGKAFVINLKEVNRGSLNEQCGGGLFLTNHVNDLSQLSSMIQTNDQTLSYFGFEEETLINFIRGLNGKGFDRIVPIGTALNFHPVWDGYDLLSELTKRISFIN